MDLIPITPERLKYRVEIEDFFLRKIVEKGKVLYEAEERGREVRETARRSLGLPV